MHHAHVPAPTRNWSVRGRLRARSELVGRASGFFTTSTSCVASSERGPEIPTVTPGGPQSLYRELLSRLVGINGSMRQVI